jgi:spermidine/putrescine-binding protein
MTTGHGHPADDARIEQELARYLAKHRMTRRELLERMTALGAAVALAPVVAACTQAGLASPSPSPSAAGPSASASAVAVASPSAAPTPSPTPQPSPEGNLFIYNWDAYIGDKTVSQFENKYGIKVKYDKFPDADRWPSSAATARAAATTSATRPRPSSRR